MVSFERRLVLKDLIRHLWIFTLLFGINDCRAVKRRLKHDPYDQPSAIPEFLQVPTNITVHEGEFAELKCYIYNLGPKMVIWRRTDNEFPLTIGLQRFTPNRRISIDHVKETRKMKTYWNLQISNVTREDAGTYECHISATEIYTTNVTLNVLDPIEYAPQLSIRGTEYVSLLENIHLICNATGGTKAPSGIDWFFDGNPVTESNPRVQILKHRPIPGRSYISELIKEKATLKDRGSYVCRSSDRIVQGLKVHVLNDLKDVKEPKRDSGPDTYGLSAEGVKGPISDSCRIRCDLLIVQLLTVLMTISFR